MDDIESQPHWLEVKIQSNAELAEALADVLGRFVNGGVVVANLTRYNPYTHENEPTENLVVSGYLPVDQALEINKLKLEEALWHLSQISPIPSPTYTLIKDQNWMDAWKAHYGPIPLGKNMLVMPAWKEPFDTQRQHIIRINPAMAFGTGTHPTTQLSMRLLETTIKPGQAVFDIGCGSGILSIAALKLGASRVLAVDVDNQAIKSTLENAALNEISPAKLEVGQGSVKDILSGQFNMQKAPVVIVNILASIILNLFEQGLANIVENEGTLLLSGILDYQENEILEVAYKAGFALIERIIDSDWVALALQKA